jgi:ABC-type molybdate transport system substrate-binding protein
MTPDTSEKGLESLIAGQMTGRHDRATVEGPMVFTAGIAAVAQDAAAARSFLAFMTAPAAAAVFAAKGMERE